MRRPLLIDLPCSVKAALGDGDAAAGRAKVLELLSAEELDGESVAACVNCKANALRRPLGCAYAVPQPTPRECVQWLIDKAAMPETIGGQLLLQTLDDTTAATVVEHSDVLRELPANPFGRTKLDGDDVLSLFEADSFAPWQCLLLLLCFSGIKVDEAAPTTLEQITALTALVPKHRARQVKLNLSPAQDPATEPVRQIFKLLFVGWVLDIAVAAP
jgi:hypothetical protein